MNEAPDKAPHQGVAVGAGAPESAPVQTAEDAVDPGAEESTRRMPTWVWITLSALGVALVAVTLGLFAEARDTSETANAASASSAQLLDDLVGNVQTTNVELKEFNDQFASASASAQDKASSAQEKKPERSSSRGQNP